MTRTAAAHNTRRQCVPLCWTCSVAHDCCGCCCGYSVRCICIQSSSWVRACSWSKRCERKNAKRIWAHRPTKLLFKVIQAIIIDKKIRFSEFNLIDILPYDKQEHWYTTDHGNMICLRTCIISRSRVQFHHNALRWAIAHRFNCWYLKVDVRVVKALWTDVNLSAADPW